MAQNRLRKHRNKNSIQNSSKENAKENQEQYKKHSNVFFFLDENIRM